MKIIEIIGLVSILVTSCQKQPKEMNPTNELIHASSAYLQQHAHNPVHWKEWSEETLKEAVTKDKPIILSIGYSSCHWCHVMEKESFEDTTVAQLMNEHFISIKVDREERPDIDNIYIDAVHQMGIRGGWPLNLFLTPDQKPFYGGTYFPKQQWMALLQNINEAFSDSVKREKITSSANEFAKDLQQEISSKYSLDDDQNIISKIQLTSGYELFSQKFDTTYGGLQQAPKFPSPAQWMFLSSYSHAFKDDGGLSQLKKTLDNIAKGGIYDQIGGGFARYSTDEKWLVPHFEKMLYDNGQLLSLYATGYKLTQKEHYKNIISETVSWLKNEMMSEEGGFYASIDADSEGEEGKFYVWTYEELSHLAKEDLEWLITYYDISPEGNWEGKTVLSIKSEIEVDRFLEDPTKVKKIEDFKKKAYTKRSERIAPTIDHKIIAGWNALTLTGLCDAYQALGMSETKWMAQKNAAFLRTKFVTEQKRLNRFPNKITEGFLDDYAAVIQSFIKYYETFYDIEYLSLAQSLTNRVDEAFYSAEEGLYYFESKNAQQLIAKKIEIFDNVIPASNSMMAWNNIHLGTLFYDDQRVEKGKKMLTKISNLVVQDIAFLANWAIITVEMNLPFFEIIIIGKDAEEYGQEINKRYLPNKIIAATAQENDFPVFNHKVMMDEKTTIYICQNKTCRLPVTSVEEALSQLAELSETSF